MGNPGDQVRDVPDVSIFAGGAEWGHKLVFCNSFGGNQNACTSGPTSWQAGSGTSFSAPIFAGIQALIDQHVGEQIGNPNPTYYAIANHEYGQYGNSSCVSVNVTTGNSCAFYDVSDLDSSGDSTTTVPCQGNIDCFLDGATYGVLSTQDSATLLLMHHSLDGILRQVSVHPTSHILSTHGPFRDVGPNKRDVQMKFCKKALRMHFSRDARRYSRDRSC